MNQKYFGAVYYAAFSLYCLYLIMNGNGDVPVAAVAPLFYNLLFLVVLSPLNILVWILTAMTAGGLAGLLEPEEWGALIGIESMLIAGAGLLQLYLSCFPFSETAPFKEKIQKALKLAYPKVFMPAITTFFALAVGFGMGRFIMGNIPVGRELQFSAFFLAYLFIAICAVWLKMMGEGERFGMPQTVGCAALAFIAAYVTMEFFLPFGAAAADKYLFILALSYGMLALFTYTEWDVQMWENYCARRRGA